jgi:hypothetical protein
VGSLSIRIRHTADSVAGANRLDQYGHPAIPRVQRRSLGPDASLPGGSADCHIKVEGSAEHSPVQSRRARAASVAMADAPPPVFPAGVTTTRSRSSYIREPNVDYSNPEVAERVARMYEQRASEIRAGLVTHGSPATVFSESSFSSLGSLSAIRGSGSSLDPRSAVYAPIVIVIS